MAEAGGDKKDKNEHNASAPSVATRDRSFTAEEEEEVVTAPTVIKGLEGKPSERRCLLIYSGGTLGMRHDEDGAFDRFFAILADDFPLLCRTEGPL